MASMKAVVYKGPYNMEVETVPKARIQEKTDALLRVTSGAICGSDLHMYDGRTNMDKGRILGHEIMGIIEEIGDAVTQIKVGDRVVLPFNISCGCCFTCSQGYTNACLTANPENAGAAYGFAGMGPYEGGQAQYVRVPYADADCLKLPGRAGDEFEDEFILLADIFPTAFHSTELAKVSIGKSVAIYGAGPVGLLAALSCQLKGASEIYVIDGVPERLALVKQLGATPIDYTKGDPVEQIESLRKHNRLIQEAARPGEQKMKGVMCGIDAVGYQAHDESKKASNESKPDTDKPTQVIEDLTRLVNPTGTIGIIGVFTPQDPGGIDPHAQKGEYLIPWGQIWEKGIAIGTGQAPVKKYNYQLRDLIMTGKAKPSLIISHRLPLEGGPDAYAKFDRRVDGYTKVILKPNG